MSQTITITLTLRQVEDATKAIATLRSPEGQSADHQFILPWLDDKEWDALFQYLRAFRNHEPTWPKNAEIIKTAQELGLARNDGSPSPKRLEIIGKTLYDVVFGHEKIRYVLRQSLEISDRDTTPIFVLHFQDAGRYIQTYPWELLHDGEEFLFDVRASLVRWIDFGQKSQHIQPIQLYDTLNVLLIDPRPTMPEKYVELPGGDRDILQKLPAEVRNQICFHELESSPSLSTLSRISTTLLSKDIHIIHIDVHGDFGWLCEDCGFLNSARTTVCQEPGCGNHKSEEQDAEGYLAFQKDDGSLTWVDGDLLGKFIAKRNVNLVFLSACESGLIAGGNVFNSVAGALIKQGVPAVVAMQLPVEVKSTKEFVYSFYNALLKYQPLAEAVPFARTTLLELEDTWYRPVLYLRTDEINKEGKIFEPTGVDEQIDKTTEHKQPIPEEKESKIELVSQDTIENIEARTPFVSDYKYDVFVSYAEVDENWVTTFIQGLEYRQGKALGGENCFSLGKSEYKTRRIETVDPLEQTAILLIVVSHAYLDSKQCEREREIFLNTLRQKDDSPLRRVCVIELEKIEDNESLQGLRGLERSRRFWERDSQSEEIRPFDLSKLNSQDLKGEEYKDTRCIEQLNDLSDKLADELKYLKSPSDREKSDAHQVVFLAEVTDDLYWKREEIRRFLELQPEIKTILPETNLCSEYEYINNPQACQEALDNDLAICNIFIQLLSESPGERPKGQLTYNRFQYEQALKTEKCILQWCDQSVNLDVEDDDQRELLATVHKMYLDNFKQKVQRTLSDVTLKTSYGGTFIFIDTKQVDYSWAKEIGKLIEEYHVKYAFPEEQIEAHKELEQYIECCDGVIVIYGKVDSSWAKGQVIFCNNMLFRREQPLKAGLVVCDGPPENKPELKVGGVDIINCRKGICKEKFEVFLGHLKAGESV